MGRTGRQASSNYIVDKDGTIYELIDPDQAAWTHGDVNNPLPSAQYLIDAGGGDPNMSAVGIEIVNKGNRDGDYEPYTPEQVEALKYLTAYLVDRYDLPRIPIATSGHNEINSI